LSSALLDNVTQLLNLRVGDGGRLEYIQDSLKKNKNLYNSDRKYLENLIDKYIPNKESAVVEPAIIPNKESAVVESAIIPNKESAVVESTIIPNKEQSFVEHTIIPNMSTKKQKNSTLIGASKSLGYKKWEIILASFILGGLSVLFIYVNPAQYFSENLRGLVIYATSALGIILEILGFLVFMTIKKKADFGGDSDRCNVTINGKPLEDDANIVIRNLKHEKKAIDLVIIGLIFQLTGMWYALQKLTIDSNLFSALNP